MTLTRVVGKGRTEPIERADLDARCRNAVRTVIDVGTGDGRYPYALATEHEDWFVIGIDALDEAMGEVAYKAGRKPAKGGRANVVYLRGAVEQTPTELRDVADEVHVMLPWGRLLEGIVVPDPDVLGGLAALGPRLHVVLNGEIWESSLPVRFDHLPVPTPEYIAAEVAPALAATGIAIGTARYLSAAEAKSLPTTWARRLGHNRDHPRFVTFDGARTAGDSLFLVAALEQAARAIPSDMATAEEVRDALFERIAYHAVSADAAEVLVLAKAYDLLLDGDDDDDDEDEDDDD